jgi:acid phosphatase (class A)
MSMMKTFAIFVVAAAGFSPALPSIAKERGGNYISNSAVDLRLVVPEPPAPGSSAAKADLNAVIASQAARTSVSIYQAQNDRKRSVKAFASALGAGFSAERFPLTTALIKDAVDDTRGILGQSKTIWKRERPFRLDRSITACVKEPDTASYPSSHAASGYVIAFLLARMLPEQAIALRSRAEEFVNGRLVCGVHYPTDISAGRIAADAIFARLMADQSFTADFAKARTELRRGLNYTN